MLKSRTKLSEVNGINLNKAYSLVLNMTDSLHAFTMIRGNATCSSTWSAQIIKLLQLFTYMGWKMLLFQMSLNFHKKIFHNFESKDILKSKNVFLITAISKMFCSKLLPYSKHKVACEVEIRYCLLFWRGT